MSYRTKKSEVLRARCTEQLKSDVNQIASLQQLEEADIVRIACTELVRKFKNTSLPFGAAPLHG